MSRIEGVSIPEMVVALAVAVPLTLVLGSTVALSFFLGSGGDFMLRVPDVVGDEWSVIYPLVALFAATVLFIVARALRGRMTLTVLPVVVLAAWAGQYLVLASGTLANELTPANSVYFWLLATGGPLQPIAAFVGGWLSLRRSSDVGTRI